MINNLEDMKMQVSYSRRNIDIKILQLAWPTITEQILIMMVGIVSTILVSRLGKEAMAGVGMVNNLISFIQTVFAGLATGSTIIVARATGENGIKRAKKVLMQSIFLGSIVGFIFFILSLASAEFVLKLFFGNAEASVLKIALDYYRIVIIGMPFLILDLVVGGAIRGVGDTKTPLNISVIVNIINIIVSVLLIFGIRMESVTIIPHLGIVGAAIATTIARIFGGVMIVSVLFKKNKKIYFDAKDKINIDLKIIIRIIKVGIPAFIENLIMQGGMLIMQMLIVNLGTAEVAGYQIGNNIHQLAVMPIMGLATIANTMVGQNLGKRDYKMAEVYAYETNKLAIFVGIAATILEFTFAVDISRIYSNDAKVINAAVIVTRGFAIIEPLLGIERVSASVIRCAGDIRYVIVTSVLALWIFRVFISFFIVNVWKLGLYGVVIGIFLDFCVRGIMYIVKIKKGEWRYLKV